MASIGKLVAAIAAVEGLEEGTVKLVARYAREAGYISQGSYGPGAAKMTSLDAANLLIAVNASSLAKDAPATIAAFTALRLSNHHYPKERIDPADGRSRFLNAKMSEASLFPETLSQIIDALRVSTEENSQNDALTRSDYRVLVTFSTPDCRAKIIVEDRRRPDFVQYWAAYYGDLAPFGFTEDVPDRLSEVTISKKTLSAVSLTISQ